jgi:hypothetical protein
VSRMLFHPERIGESAVPFPNQSLFSCWMVHPKALLFPPIYRQQLFLVFLPVW